MSTTVHTHVLARAQEMGISEARLLRAIHHPTFTVDQTTKDGPFAGNPATGHILLGSIDSIMVIIDDRRNMAVTVRPWGETRTDYLARR